MKANQKFAQADEAVSPVIGVILMVAITVVLAAVVFVLVNNLTGDTDDAAPVAKLSAEADNEADDILIKHLSGDTLTDGEFEVSIVADGLNPIYIACSDADYEAGFQFRATTQTDADAACGVTAGTIAGAGATALAAGDYQVSVRHVSSGSVLLNTVITVL